MNSTDFATLSTTICNELTFTQLADRTGVLLDLEGQQVLTLNSTGCAVVSAITDGANNIEDLAQRLTATFDVDETTARQDVSDYLEELSKLVSR